MSSYNSVVEIQRVEYRKKMKKYPWEMTKEERAYSLNGVKMAPVVDLLKMQLDAASMHAIRETPRHTWVVQRDITIEVVKGNRDFFFVVLVDGVGGVERRELEFTERRLKKLAEMIRVKPRVGWVVSDVGRAFLITRALRVRSRGFISLA